VIQIERSPLIVFDFFVFLQAAFFAHLDNGRNARRKKQKKKRSWFNLKSKNGRALFMHLVGLLSLFFSKIMAFFWLRNSPFFWTRIQKK